MNKSMQHPSETAPSRTVTENEKKNVGGVFDFQEITVTPAGPDDEDGYTLEGFGDISLSNIDYVPPAPTLLSPSKALGVRPHASKTKSTSPRGSVHKPKVASRSRGRINSADMSFPSLVATLKNLREREETGGMSSGHVAGPPEKQFLDLLNLGGEAAISEGRLRPDFKNSDDMDMRHGAEHDKNIIGGGTKKRKAIPRWF